MSYAGSVLRMVEPSAAGPLVSSLAEVQTESEAAPKKIPITSLPAPPVSGFSSTAPQFLSLEEGDVVTVYAELPDDWYEGKANGKRGRFPRFKLMPMDELQRAAENGNPSAQREMGARYEWAYGTPEDYYAAAKWYRMAAEQGDAAAQFKVAWEYSSEGKDTDAFRWFMKSALGGDLDAQFSLALRYDRGNGVKKDRLEAARWFRQAAEQGHIFAQYNLAMFLLEGRAGVTDKEQAVLWLRRAAAEGDADSHVELGHYWRYRNPDKALHWYSLAAVMYNKTAVVSLSTLMPDLGKETVKIA